MLKSFPRQSQCTSIQPDYISLATSIYRKRNICRSDACLSHQNIPTKHTEVINIIFHYEGAANYNYVMREAPVIPFHREGMKGVAPLGTNVLNFNVSF